MSQNSPTIDTLHDDLTQALAELIAFHTPGPAEIPDFSAHQAPDAEPESDEALQRVAAMRESSERRLEEAYEAGKRKNQAFERASLAILRLRRHPETAAGALKAAREIASYRLRLAEGPDKREMRESLLPWMAEGFEDIVKGLTSIQGLSERQLEEKGEELLKGQVQAAEEHFKGWSKLFAIRQRADDEWSMQLIGMLEDCRRAAASPAEPADSPSPLQQKMAIEMLVGRLQEVADVYLSIPEKQEDSTFPGSSSVSVEDTLEHSRRMLKSIRDQQKAPEGNKSTRSGGGELAITGTLNLGEAYVWLAALAPAAPPEAVERIAAALAKIDVERQGFGTGGFLKGPWSSQIEDEDYSSDPNESVDDAIARLQARWNAQSENWRSCEVQQRLQVANAVMSAIELSRGLALDQSSRVLN